MKYILFAILFSLIPASLLSQTSEFYDIVYLKKGNYVKGMVLSIENDIVEIVDMKGKAYTFKMDEVEKIEKTDFDRNIYLNIDPDSKVDRNSLNKTMYALTKLSINRNYIDKKSYLGGTIAGGVKFGGLGLGLAIAYNSYTILEDEAYLPLMLDVRYTFYYPVVRPYIYFNPGYSFKFKDRDGMMLSAGVGGSIKFNNYISGIVELGYYWQKFQKEILNYKVVGSSDFLTLNFGLQLF